MTDLELESKNVLISALKNRLNQIAADAKEYREVADSWAAAYRRAAGNLKAAEVREERLKKRLEEALDPKFLRDLSKLASNPAQNAAVRDIQNIIKRILSDEVKA